MNATERLRSIHYTALTIVELVALAELSGFVIDIADDDKDLAHVDELVTSGCDALRNFTEEL